MGFVDSAARDSYSSEQEEVTIYLHLVNWDQRYARTMVHAILNRSVAWPMAMGWDIHMILRERVNEIIIKKFICG